MKKLLVSLCMVMMLATGGTAHAYSSAAQIPADKAAQIQLLMQLLETLKAMLAQMQGGSSVGQGDVQKPTTAYFDKEVFQTTSENPIISGSAVGYNSVGFSIDNGDKVYGSGQISVVNETWSHKVSTDLNPGVYSIKLYYSNNLVDTATLKVVDASKLENLSIYSTTIGHSTLIGNASEGYQGQPVTVHIETEDAQTTEASMIDVDMYLYERISTEAGGTGKWVKTDKFYSKYISTSHGDGLVSFDVDVAGGVSKKPVAEYKLKIVVDSGNNDHESNENDNVGWTKVWRATYSDSN